MMRAVCWSMLCGVLCLGAMDARGATVADWIAIAEDSSPLLAAQDARVEAARSGADAAGNWPSPEVGYAWFAEPVQTRVGPQEHRLSLTQPLPVFGNTGLRAGVARAETTVARARREAVRESLALRLSRLWNEMWLLDRSLEVAREDLALVDALHRSALGQYRAGQGSQSTLVRFELERDRAADDLRSIEAQRAPLRARINAELGRAPDDALGMGDHPTGTGVVPPLDSLRAALRTNPDLAVADAQAEVARANRDLVSRERWPALNIGLDYIFTGDAVQPGVPDSGQDAVLVRAGLRLPWPFEGAGDETARSRALLVAARADANGLARRLEAELEAAWFEFEEAGRRAALLEDALIPGADRALVAVQAAFAAGETVASDLLETRRTRLALTLEQLELTARRANAEALLTALTAESRTGEE